MSRACWPNGATAGKLRVSIQIRTLRGIADWENTFVTDEFPVNEVALSYEPENNKNPEASVRPCYAWRALCETGAACVKTFLTSAGKPQIPFYDSDARVLSLGGNETDQRRVKRAFDRLIELFGEKLKKSGAEK